ncbi:nucleotide sugar dehydrogenase [Methanospirillum stamsii]|uniref:UDP-N-acetyl-D-mannosamine dehydrogenase n=1 Tax=Methanospirillum stamsii TaxID=1277351 RepID=A0A2V2MYU0_9EURY|nr:nucleotide sugar dehydrogenase [Methanospirillum stamsii]PWR69498.1 nucleotide sugar dehydrogenase [Methanospirillum stamsii]
MDCSLSEYFKKRGSIKTIGVIGMGYVGIPAAALFARSFDKVYGFQRDSSSSGYKIDLLNSGKNPLKGEEPGLDDLIRETTDKSKFECTADFSKISLCDAVTIDIQTPFLNPGDLIPDFSALEEGIRQAGRYLTKGSLIVLESTITPGTTAIWAKKILEEESGFIAGEDFGLAHAPERVMVGRLLRNIQEHDRIVGGIDDASTKRAMELYGPVLTSGNLIPMTATAAEVTKTAENTVRDLQIAAANQLALYCEAMGINFYDVRRGIDSLKGDGITRAILLPGAGVGGHCLTKDTYHLERGVKIADEQSVDFPEGVESLYVTARHINDFMPRHMFHLLKKGLNRSVKDMKGAKVALLGWSFLANTDDARNTPAEPFYQLCKDAGAEIRVHDPWVTGWPGIDIRQDLESVLSGVDAVVVFTAHRMYYQLDSEKIRKLSGSNSCVIVDGRNIIDPDTYIRNGFVYLGIGRGDKNSHPL